EPASLLRQRGLEGPSQGGKGIADHLDALAAFAPAGQDDRLQSLQRPWLYRPPYELRFGESQIVEPEIRQQPRAVQGRLGGPGLPRLRRRQGRRLAAQPAQGVPAVEVGRVGLSDVIVDLLRPLALAQRFESPSRPVTAPAGVGVLRIEREELRPVADGARVVAPAVLLPARLPEAGGA